LNELPPERKSILPAETWRRNQIGVSVAAGLLFFGFTLVMPFLPLFIESLGSFEAQEVVIWSGVVLFVAPFLAAVMGPLWGRMTDRYGMKIMIQRIFIAMILHWLLMYFVSSLAHLLILRVMLGVFSGFGTISVALVTHGVPRDQVGRVVGTLQSVQILSAAAGPAIGGFLYDLVGLRLTFLITAGVCTAAFVLVTVTYRDIAPGDRSGTDAEARPLAFREILRMPGIVPALLLLFFVNMVDRSFGLIVPLFLQVLVAPGAALGMWSGLTVSAGAFASAASALWLGRAAGRGAARRWMQWSLSAGSVLLLIMALSPGPWSFAILRMVYGLAAGGLLALGYTVASYRVGKRSHATVYGLLSGGAMLGASMGPLASGLLAPWIGFPGYLAGSSAILLGLAVLARWGARREREVARAAEEAAQPYIPLPR